jgi:hypothetical protein
VDGYCEWLACTFSNLWRYEYKTYLIMAAHGINCVRQRDIKRNALKKCLGEFPAHRISTVSLIIFCLIYVWFVYPLMNIHNSKQAFTIGLDAANSGV